MEGSFDTIPLSDVLEMIHASRGTGVLQLVSDGLPLNLHFEGGEVVGGGILDWKGFEAISTFPLHPDKGRFKFEAGNSLLFDLLTFPITQGDEESRKLAMWTIESIRKLRLLLPEVGFILGISNVSFGLVPQARLVLNSVFLDGCIQAGPTAAILNAGNVLPINQIPPEPYQLALDLIYHRRQFGPDGEAAHDPLFAFVDYFAKNKVGQAQARDPLAGLSLEDRLKKRIVEGRKVGLEAGGRQYKTAYEILQEKLMAGSAYTPSQVPPAPGIPQPPFWGRRVAPSSELEIGVISRYVNKKALFRGQWGFHRGEMSQAEYQAYLERLAEPMFEELVLQAMGEGWLEAAVAYGYWPVASDQNDLIVFDPSSGAELLRFNFPRQTGTRSRYLCIADFFRPRHAEALSNEADWFPRAAWDNGARDLLGAQMVTMGGRVSQVAQKLFHSNAYQDYLYLHGFSVEMTEALAEYWHKRVRQQLGIAHNDATSMEELFRQGYQGSRYSFGYPACPHLEDQKYLQTLLQWQEIGVELSEEFQLHPEQSTSAIVVHHPAAKYFNL